MIFKSCPPFMVVIKLWLDKLLLQSLIFNWMIEISITPRCLMVQPLRIGRWQSFTQLQISKDLIILIRLIKNHWKWIKFSPFSLKKIMNCCEREIFKQLKIKLNVKLFSQILWEFNKLIKYKEAIKLTMISIN